jgi:hypothetical protein
MRTRHRTPTPLRRTLPALLAGATALLAACGSGSAAGPVGAPSPDPAVLTSAPAPSLAAATSSTPPETVPTTTTGPERCPTTALTGSLRTGDAGAGQRSATLILTNRSSRPCRLDGYGGIQLADTAGEALPTRQVRDPGTAPRSVLLAPGAAGASLLRWTAVPGAGGSCRPTPTSLRVIPPDERTALTVPWSLGPVCDGGRISQGAYRTP